MIVHNRRVYRDMLATRVRNMRSAFHQSNQTTHDKRPFIRSILNLDSAPPKPTPQNLDREAIALFRESRRPLPWDTNPHWTNPHSTEYYSACGHEDAIIAAREDAREAALYLFRAWKEVRHTS